MPTPFDVKQAHADRLMRLPNVVGVGVGLRQVGGQYTDEVCIVVFVRRKVGLASLRPEDRIPTEIEGVRVDVQDTGGGFAAR